MNMIVNSSAVALATPVAAFDSAKEDPIFAAIENARAAERTIDGLDENEMGEAYLDAQRAILKAREDLAHAVPTTPAGLAALTGFLREADVNLCGAAPYFDDAEESAAFHVSLDTAVRGMVGLQPWQPPADVDVGERQDAVLLELGRQFEPTLEEWANYQERSAADQQAFEARVKKATGLDLADVKEKLDALDVCWRELPASHPLRAYWETRLKMPNDHGDDENWDREYTRVNDLCEPLAKAIMAQPAATLAGFAVKARALLYFKNAEWEEAESEGDVALQNLLRELCTVAGAPMIEVSAA